jgi:glycosyltransferase involved in cell wall biosynthesis
MADSATAPNLLARRGGVLLTMHSFSQGGGDRNGVVLASGFARAGIPTRIVLMRSGGEGEDELKPLLHRDVSLEVGGPPMDVPMQAQMERLRGLNLIRRQIDDFRPAVVLGVTDNMAFINSVARRVSDTRPLFAQKLTNRIFRPTIDSARKIYRHTLFKFIFSRLDLVITLTEAERRDALSHYPGREELFRTVPNPHVTDDMLVDRPPRALGPPRLLTAGRMVRQKRYDLLLRAFAAMRHADARLTILGDGPLRSSLESLATSLGIADRVDMPGFDPSIIDWIRRSDLIVMSSDYEGLPGVLIRSLACNVPVVTTDSFLAARELIGPASSCAVVPTGDAEALARAIDRCLDAKHSENLRKIVEPYRVDAAIGAHIAALGRLVEERSQAIAA